MPLEHTTASHLVNKSGGGEVHEEEGKERRGEERREEKRRE